MCNKNIQKFQKILVIACIMLTFIIWTVGCNKEVNDANVVTYEGEDYASLEYPENVFYYVYNGNSNDNFGEVDGIYPIESPKWPMIWNGGDLYCAKEQVIDANAYYASEDNYDWYVLIDTEDDETNSYPIKLTKTELEGIYEVEDMEKDLAVYFDEFESLGSVIKISKDGLVRGIISIAKYDGKWYWKSEIIDESRTRDDTWPEYIQPLPESLNSKIKEVE